MVCPPIWYLGRIGNEGVLVMMGDSTRVETAGFTPSERVINDRLTKSSPTPVAVSLCHLRLVDFASAAGDRYRRALRPPGSVSGPQHGQQRANGDRAWLSNYAKNVADSGRRY